MPPGMAIQRTTWRGSRGSAITFPFEVTEPREDEMWERERLTDRWIALIVIAVCGLLTSGTTAGHAGEWQVTADVAESCSCDVTCPCNFGSEPTHDYCHGNRLYEVTSGHFGGTDISGLQFLVTFSMREWAKLYVSDDASDAQAAHHIDKHILGAD